MKSSRKKTNLLFVLMKNKVPLALRKVKDFNAPGKLESGVLQLGNYRKLSLCVPVFTTLRAECSNAAVSDNY